MRRSGDSSCGVEAKSRGQGSKFSSVGAAIVRIGKKQLGFFLAYHEASGAEPLTSGKNCEELPGAQPSRKSVGRWRFGHRDLHTCDMIPAGAIWRSLARNSSPRCV